ncbi:MAG: DNA alkylation repair protein [Gemmatimonadaceae bacterium]
MRHLPAARKKLYDTYLAHTKYVNNWDLVDSSARHIVGAQLFDLKAGTKVLDNLAKSPELWERRRTTLSG